MISPAPNLTPPQIGEGPLPLGSDTRIMSAGTATRATRGRCSSAADSRKRCSAIRVNRARNTPGPVTSRPKQPSARMAAAKSLASPNTEVTLRGTPAALFLSRRGCGVCSGLGYSISAEILGGRGGTFRSVAIVAIIPKGRHHIAKIITHLAWENGPAAAVTSPASEEQDDDPPPLFRYPSQVVRKLSKRPCWTGL